MDNRLLVQMLSRLSRGLSRLSKLVQRLSVLAATTLNLHSLILIP